MGSICAPVSFRTSRIKLMNEWTDILLPLSGEQWLTRCIIMLSWGLKPIIFSIRVYWRLKKQALLSQCCALALLFCNTNDPTAIPSRNKASSWQMTALSSSNPPPWPLFLVGSAPLWLVMSLSLASPSNPAAPQLNSVPWLTGRWGRKHLMQHRTLAQLVCLHLFGEPQLIWFSFRGISDFQ